MIMATRSLCLERFRPLHTFDPSLRRNPKIKGGERDREQ
jgi:hypothetical protein